MTEKLLKVKLKPQQHSNTLSNNVFQALQFNRVVDDLLSWIDEVEHQLMSEDHGKDLTSVKNLLKKHQVGRDSCQCVAKVTVLIQRHKF